ncbi:MAG: hypothetical protein IKK38_06735 [Spirochaetaceae bacterium]|nr:hypothetical protein [Spirochaetaceae bacterium]
MIHSIETYRKKRMQIVEPFIEGLELLDGSIFVCIPAINEYPLILKTIESLEKARLFYEARRKAENLEPKKICYVINVNNRQSHSDEVKRNNQQLLETVRAYDQSRFRAIDACSDGRTMSEKDGAGLARKIALDFAYLSSGGTSDSLLCCMDSDTLVDEDYFCTVDDAFFGGAISGGANPSKKKPCAGVTGFSHRLDGTAQENSIIVEYEAYLKNHAEKLKAAKSPWFYVALGPTLICTAETYAACGGMNRHVAGEDFYYLQALLKSTNEKTFIEIPTSVHPSPRVSWRVPFGTGAAISGTINGTYKIKDFSDEAFKVLADFIALAEELSAKAVKEAQPLSEEFLARAAEISPVLADFLKAEKFGLIWQNLFSQNRRSAKTLVRAFHCWFDGLKTIRLFHALEKD